MGGFLDAYTYLSRNGVFATAQTGNIVLMVVVAFIVGVVLVGCALTLLMGGRAVWAAAGVLFVSVAFFVLDERVRPGA